MPPSVSGPRRYKSLETGNCIGIPGGQLLFRHGQTALPHLVSCAKSGLRRFVLYIDRSSHHAYIKEHFAIFLSSWMPSRMGTFWGFNKVLDSFWGWGKLGHNLPTPSRRPKLRPLGIVPSNRPSPFKIPPPPSRLLLPTRKGLRAQASPSREESTNQPSTQKGSQDLGFPFWNPGAQIRSPCEASFARFQ